MYAAWRSGDLLTGAPTTTIAEGLAARVPVPEAVGSMRTSVDDFVLVDDDALREAMRVLLAHTGLVSEPSGAAALAGAMLLRAELVGGTRSAAADRREHRPGDAQSTVGYLTRSTADDAGTADGCRIAAIASTPSTSRGPGRTTIPSASIAQIAGPGRAAATATACSAAPARW